MNQFGPLFKLGTNRRTQSFILVVVMGAFLSACSVPNWVAMPKMPSVPSWAKPSTALDKVTGIFSRYKGTKESQGGSKAVSLSEVPKRPKSSSAAERRATADGLVADRKNARYTDEVIRRKEEKPVVTAQSSTVSSKTTFSKQKKLKEIKKADTSKKAKVKSSASRRLTVGDPLESRRIITTGRASKDKKGRGLVTRAEKSPVRVTIPKPSSVQPKPKRVQEKAIVAPTPKRSLTTAPKLADRLIPSKPSRSGGSVVSQTYSQMLAQSAATVSTVPANAAFKPSLAKPLAEGETTVLPILRESYNAALRSTDDILVEDRTNLKSVSSSQVPLEEISSAGQLPDAVISFGHDSKVLSADDRATLRKLAARHSEEGGGVLIIGHASSKTRDMDIVKHQLVNFRISVDRAQAVAKELIRLSVPAELITVEARGASELRYLEAMPSGEAGNRRAEIYLGRS